MDQKRMMIGKFLEVRHYTYIYGQSVCQMSTSFSVQTIPVYTKAAKDNADRFHELAKEVEVFPRKVAAALRIKAEPAGFFESIWTGIEE